MGFLNTQEAKIYLSEFDRGTLSAATAPTVTEHEISELTMPSTLRFSENAQDLIVATSDGWLARVDLAAAFAF